MEIEVHPLPGNITCASINGRIDSYTTERVEDELNSLIKIGSFKLICDLTDVEFVSSSGFRVFRRIISSAREQGGDVKFCGLSSEVAKLFNSVGFSKEAGVFSSQEEALADYESPAEDSGPVETESGIKSRLSELLNTVRSKKSDDTDAEIDRVDDAALQQTQILNQKSSALQETVIFTDRKTADDSEDGEEVGHFPVIEPVLFKLYPEPAHFQNASQLLGKIGTLVGVSSTEMVKLNVAFTEFCRSMVEELEEDETFSIQFISKPPGFQISIDIPRKNYHIYQHLRPKTTSKELTEDECKEWFFNYVDELEQSPSDAGTVYLLSLSE